MLYPRNPRLTTYHTNEHHAITQPQTEDVPPPEHEPVSSDPAPSAVHVSARPYQEYEVLHRTGPILSTP